MSTKRKIILLVLLCILGMLVTVPFVWGADIAVLNPKGLIALKERNLLVLALLLMMIVVIPVFILTIYISWKYKEGHSGKYDPDWDYHRVVEWIWWGVPCLIVAALGWITWVSSHELDPYKPLDHEEKPITIQVIALQWKWLFLYPEQNIATVNFVQFPENTPISFEITADAPMNSFWIPQLGSQIYAMPGMKTKVHLIADAAGEFRGSSANLSGEGFASMVFTAKATSKADFDQWVQTVQQSSNGLSLQEYNELAEPKGNAPVAFYSLKEPDLYNQVVMKYMMPMPMEHSSSEGR